MKKNHKPLFSLSKKKGNGGATRHTSNRITLFNKFFLEKANYRYYISP